VTVTVVVLTGVALAIGGAVTAVLGYTGTASFAVKWGNKSLSSSSSGLIIMVVGAVLVLAALWLVGKYPQLGDVVYSRRFWPWA
jgi:hypothetical protein